MTSKELAVEINKRNDPALHNQHWPGLGTEKSTLQTAFQLARIFEFLTKTEEFAPIIITQDWTVPDVNASN